MSKPTPIILPDAAAVRIIQGDLALLKDGLSRGLNPKIVWPMWQMPLLHGICYFLPPSAVEMAEVVLQSGATAQDLHQELSPNLWNIGGFNVETGDPLGVRLALLKALYDPETDVSLDIFACIRVGFNAGLEWYLEQNHSANMAVEDNWTFLHEAYGCQNAKAAALLLNAGADEKAKTLESKRTPEKLLASLRKDEREHFLLDVEALRHHGQLAPATASPRL
jgi:hypothetical protein